MRKFFGVMCMLLGVAMLCGAGWLLYENYTEDQAAGQGSEVALEQLRELMENEPTPAPTPTPEPTEEPELLPPPTLIPEMRTMTIDGHEYIGYLEMPTIGLTLPVMSDWSYAKLRIAPCRYRGSAYDDSLVIMAHNYDRHFGRISSLEAGAPVQFIDADGNIYRYKVVGQEELQRTDYRDMIAEEWGMTLFTCTYGGATRVTVRLERVVSF